MNIDEKEPASLIQILKTNETIDEWHTLTYLCLNVIQGIQGNQRFMISAVAENGYLFVWRAED